MKVFFLPFFRFCFVLGKKGCGVRKWWRVGVVVGVQRERERERERELV